MYKSLLHLADCRYKQSRSLANSHDTEYRPSYLYFPIQKMKPTSFDIFLPSTKFLSVIELVPKNHGRAATGPDFGRDLIHIEKIISALTSSSVCIGDMSYIYSFYTSCIQILLCGPMQW